MGRACTTLARTLVIVLKMGRIWRCADVLVRTPNASAQMNGCDDLGAEYAIGDYNATPVLLLGEPTDDGARRVRGSVFMSPRRIFWDVA